MRLSACPGREFFVLVVFLSASSARAQTVALSGSMTVDNAFSVYISTSDSVAGTFVTSGSNWPQTFTFSVDLTPRVVNYLHVQATDFGAPAAFIGSFTLNGTDFFFGNGTQSLVTAPTAFTMSLTGFGSNYATPTSAGTNGVGPWGFFSGIAANAQWLAFPGGSTVFFSAEVIPVPEPATFELLVLGVLTVGLAARRSCLGSGR